MLSENFDLEGLHEALISHTWSPSPGSGKRYKFWAGYLVCVDFALFKFGARRAYSIVHVPNIQPIQV